MPKRKKGSKTNAAGRKLMAALEELHHSIMTGDTSKRIVRAVFRRRRGSATNELLSIPGFLDSLVRGTKDVRAGRVKPWDKLRDDV